jgi:hypothetical protein
VRPLLKFLLLPGKDRSLVFRVALLLLATRAGLALLGYSRLKRLFARFSNPPAHRSEAPLEDVDRVVWAVGKVGPRLLGDRRCLVDAMVTQLLLSRRKLHASIQIGVLFGEGGKLEAHAWIEHDGRVLVGGSSGLERYSRIPPLAM